VAWPLPVKPATVLDPFLGSGTTALVADQLGRDCIGIELSESYARMAENRIRNDAGMFAEIAAE
jgi:DNA modification methylase